MPLIVRRAGSRRGLVFFLSPARPIDVTPVSDSTVPQPFQSKHETNRLLVHLMASGECRIGFEVFCHYPSVQGTVLLDRISLSHSGVDSLHLSQSA